MRHFKIFSASISFLLLILCGTAYAVSTTSDGSAKIVPVLTANFYQDLYFGAIVPNQTNASTVKVLRGNNNSSICGTGLTCLENGNRARIRITGAPGHRFSLSDPGSTTLSDGNGNSMLVDTFVGGGSGNDNTYGKIILIKPNGIANLNIGATLHVPANQPAGLYSGSYILTASYE